ncbi:MAG: hypothetical protein WDN49_14370 [Acetobacteraceae bacterium]
MADEHSPSRLRCEGLLGGVNVIRQGCQRVLNEGDVVTLLRQDVGHWLPAGLVDERSVDQHDVVGRPLGRLGCVNRREEGRAGKKNGG